MLIEFAPCWVWDFCSPAWDLLDYQIMFWLFCFIVFLGVKWWSSWFYLGWSGFCFEFVFFSSSKLNYGHQRSKTLVWWDEHPILCRVGVDYCDWFGCLCAPGSVHVLRESLVYLHLGLLAGGAVIELGTVCFASMEDVSRIWHEQIESKTNLFISHAKVISNILLKKKCQQNMTRNHRHMLTHMQSFS